MGRTLAVDGNWVLHRIFYTTTYAVKDLSASIAWNFLNRICIDALAVKASSIIVAFDGFDVFRYHVYSQYKGNRGDNSDVYAHLDKTKEFVRSAGIQVIHKPSYEADDISCSLASVTDNLVIATKDKDTYQCLRPGVSLYDSSFRVNGQLRPRFVHDSDVKTLTGLSPKQFHAYQVLIGDGIDNVPRLMSPAKAKAGIKTWGTFSKWCANDKEIRNWAAKNRKALALNHKLVTLVSDLQLKIKPMKLVTEGSWPRAYSTFVDVLNPRSRGLFGG